MSKKLSIRAPRYTNRNAASKGQPLAKIDHSIIESSQSIDSKKRQNGTSRSKSKSRHQSSRRSNNRPAMQA